MKSFILKSIYFLLPLIIWAIAVIFIDPYNFFSNNLNLVDDKLKSNISHKLNRPLFQLLKFKHSKSNAIILGDSRANSLNIDQFIKYSDKKFSSLAYGGGSLLEVIKTFWEVVENGQIDEVYIGINFTMYNKYSNRDRVSEAIRLKDNFLLYAYSSYTLNSTFGILKALITGIEPTIGVPTTSREQFWEHQLKISARDSYQTYQYPDNYLLELKRIAKYCNKNSIKLVFFIPPGSIDLQNKVKEFKLSEYEERFKNDIKALGDVYDFDFPSGLTKNRENFIDPYHFTPDIGNFIIREFFITDSNSFVRFSRYQSSNKLSK